MTPHAKWSSEAKSDLEDVALYIALNERRPASADCIVREVHALCNLIATQPRMGQERPEFGERCRVVSFENRWVILYRPAEGGIEVLRFVDGKRDYDQLF